MLKNIIFTIWFKQAHSSMERITKENKISKTTYYKIKNDCTIHNLSNIIADEYERNNQLSEEVKESIKAYVKPPTHPITIKELQEKIKEQNRLELTNNQIRTFREVSWNIHINKGSTKNMRLVTQTSSELLSLYSSKMLIQIFCNKVIFNIDEWGFSKLLKKSYSWLPVDLWSSILNDIHIGRWNLILTISNAGDWIGMIITFNVISNEYWVYLKLVLKILKKLEYSISRDCLCTRLVPLFIWQRK